MFANAWPTGPSTRPIRISGLASVAWAGGMQRGFSITAFSVADYCVQWLRKPRIIQLPLRMIAISTSSDRHNRHRVSCIICAFNEAPRIGAVLAVASAHPLLGEVIVVDDGSAEGTAEDVKRFPSVRLIQCEVTRGKSAAMAVGIAAAQNELLMLLDADLKGLA